MSTGELLKQHDLSAAFNLNMVRVVICAMRRMGLTELEISADEIADLPEWATLHCEESMNFWNGRHGVHIWHNVRQVQVTP